MTCRTAIRRRTAGAAATTAAAPVHTHRRGRARLGWILGGLAALGLVLAGFGVARAAPAADPAQQVVDAAIADVTQIFGQPSLTRADAAAQLRTLLDRYVDLPRIGRDSVGAHWRRAAPEQQAAFLTLFESFLCAGYSGSVTRFGSVLFGPTVIVETSDATTVVRTDALVIDSPPQPVFFTVGRAEDGAWRITDVVAASISFTRLLSADFGAVLRTNGGEFRALIELLERKLAATNPTP